MTKLIAYIRAHARVSLTELARSPRSMQRADIVLQLFYAFVPLLAFMFLNEWSHPSRLVNFDPLWPLGWTTFFHVSADTAVDIVRLVFVAVSITGVLFYRHRAVRFLVFLCFWQAHALSSSFAGNINHQWYPWVFVSLILVFTPSQEADDRDRKKLLVIWWAQAFVMLVYSMAGFWKFYIAFLQAIAGQIHGFSPLAFAYQVADWLPKLQGDAMLGPAVIAHPYLAWPFYVGSHFFQLFAFWTMFRPSLQRLWMTEIISFHILTYMIMGISFEQLIPLIVILFLFSPFSPEKVSLLDIFLNLPLIGPLASYASKRLMAQSRNTSHPDSPRAASQGAGTSIETAA